MKKYGILLICIVFSMAAMAQKAVINFEKKNYDFGKVKEEDGKITTTFSFKNEGNSPLVINRVQASCGCTTPTWTKEPIEPGKSGSIVVTYNPLGRPGIFVKTITVYSNATDEQTILIIKGDVIPKQTVDENAYPINMHGLLLKTKVIQMNNIEKGKSTTRSIEIKNGTNAMVLPVIENLPPYISVSTFPVSLKPKEEGKINFTFKSKNCPEWGPISNNLYLNSNGQKVKSEDNKLLVVANVVEDFSNMTLDQKRKAPIIEIPKRIIDLGTIKSGSKKIVQYTVYNKGENPLEIRRIINNNSELTVRQTKLSVKSGKNAAISVELNGGLLPPGNYKRSFTIQTNDPDNSFMILVLSWKEEK